MWLRIAVQSVECGDVSASSVGATFCDDCCVIDGVTADRSIVAETSLNSVVRLLGVTWHLGPALTKLERPWTYINGSQTPGPPGYWPIGRYKPAKAELVPAHDRFPNICFLMTPTSYVEFQCKTFIRNNNWRGQLIYSKHFSVSWQPTYTGPCN